MLRSLSIGRRWLASFHGCGVIPELCERLQEQGITTPTTVQAKSLTPVLEGKHVIINAETGSGKTLCYILPIVQSIQQFRGHIPTPHSLVLVPTPDLAVQVCDVFTNMTTPPTTCCVCCSGSRLTITSHTQCVVAVPRSLMNYDLRRLLSDVHIVCVDEVDALLSGGESKPTWRILNTLRDLHQRQTRSDNGRQLIMTGATLPEGGPQTTGSILSRWMPQQTLYITTQYTHQTITSSHHTFTPLTTPISENTPTSRDSLIKLKLNQLKNDLMDLHGNQSRILVFANTQATVELLYSYLVEVGVVTTPHYWWVGYVGQLHGKMSIDERGEVIKAMREGMLKVLVCTDLMSRGIDLPDVTAVIQYDFPENSAHYLHRAGRTARAGKEGKVISYILDDDKDLAQEIENVLNDRSKSFQQIFSRNKMLRRKIKSRKNQELKTSEQC